MSSVGNGEDRILEQVNSGLEEQVEVTLEERVEITETSGREENVQGVSQTQNSATNRSRMAAKIEPPAFVSQAKLYAMYKKVKNVIKDHKHREKVIDKSSPI